jgi:hypothetical protein
MVGVLVATFSWFSSLNSLIQHKKKIYIFPSIEYIRHNTGRGRVEEGGGGSVEN